MLNSISPLMTCSTDSRPTGPGLSHTNWAPTLQTKQSLALEAKRAPTLQTKRAPDPKAKRDLALQTERAPAQ